MIAQIVITYLLKTNNNTHFNKNLIRFNKQHIILRHPNIKRFERGNNNVNKWRTNTPTNLYSFLISQPALSDKDHL